MSPTQRSLAHLRAKGFLVAVTERWNTFAKIRQDLFGFIDLVALDGQPGLLAVQTTTGDNVSKRVAKIVGECSAAAERWLAAGNRIEVHGWRKVAKGGRARWEVREVEILRTEIPPPGPS